VPAPIYPPAVTPDTSRPLAVITGPTAGIGRAFAERLAARGHDLVLVARDAARLAALADELTVRHGVGAEPWAGDLSDDAEMERLATALAARPRVDVLVNNAGFGTLGTVARADPAGQSRMVHLHCVAPLRLAQAVLPAMLARRAGLVVNVASVAAFVTGPGNATYSGTKAFVQLWSEGLAAEVGHAGVRVQALCPGFTRTEFHERMRFAPSNIPGLLWMGADAVVDASLRAADRGGPVTVVPGLHYRAMVAVLRHLPLRARAAFAGRAPRKGRAEP